MDQGTRPVNRFQVQTDKNGSSIDVEIHVSRLRAENLNLKTWGSSHVLANQLHLLDLNAESLGQEEFQILELGAGTGLVGLSAAAIWKANVVLTDLDTLVPGLFKNIEVNNQMLAANGASAACGTLDWNKPSELTIYAGDQRSTPKTLNSALNKATLILAADTIYDEEHPRMLTNAILAWLKPGADSRVIIAYPLRVAYLDSIRELWERLEASGLHAIDEGKAETGDEWDDERWHEWSVWAWQSD